MQAACRLAGETVEIGLDRKKSDCKKRQRERYVNPSVCAGVCMLLTPFAHYKQEREKEEATR